jgi:hypothetical protein
MTEKTLLTLALMVLISFALQSQTTFERTIFGPEDQVINCVTEDGNGNFIMVGKKYSEAFEQDKAYIIRIDSTGEIMDEISPDNAEGWSIFRNIFFYNNRIYILGIKGFDEPEITRLWYLKLENNLEVIDEKYLGIPDTIVLDYMNSIIDSDSNIVITGYTDREDSLTEINLDVFYYKLSLGGDSINSRFIISDYKLTMSYDLIEKPDQSGYYLFGLRYSNIIGSYGERLELSKEFDSLDVVSTPYDIVLYISAELLDDSTVIITGNGQPLEIPSYSLSVLTTTLDNTPIDYNHFKIEGNMRDHTALYQGVSVLDNNIYIGGTSNFNYDNPFYSTTDSWYHLIKVNPDLSPVWEYWYGGDAYYFLYSILATSDGGCLMVGNRYDYEIQEQERDIYVVKVDSAGLIVWTQEIQPDQPMYALSPNPGTTWVNLKMPPGEYVVEFLSLNGQVLLRQQIQAMENQINTSSLSPGMYIYRVIDNHMQILQTGKWLRAY